jgi:hypothetical protein
MSLLNCDSWREILGVNKVSVIESVEVDQEADCIIVNVRKRRPTKNRCEICSSNSVGYDQG